MKTWSVVRKLSFASLPISFCIIEGLRFVTSFCLSLKLNIHKTIYSFPCNSLIKDQERKTFLTVTK